MREHLRRLASRLATRAPLLARLTRAERRVEGLERKLSEQRAKARRARRSRRRALRRLERLREERDGAIVAQTRLKYEGAEIVLATPSAEAFKRRSAVLKEPFTAKWIEEMAPGAVLYDVGANVGPYSLLAAARGVRPVAFEPAYANFALLHQNVLLNSASELVTALPIALGEVTELGELELSSIEAGSALHALRGAATDLADPIVRQGVLAYRLDDVVAHFALPDPVHLKVDADGAELAVLRGGASTLRRKTLRSALVEVHDDEREELEELLLECGLEPAERHERRDRTGVLQPFSYVHFARVGS